MPPNVIHKYFMETLGKESPWNNTVKKKGEQSLRAGKGALGMMNGLAASKMPPLVKMSCSYTPWLCVIYARPANHGERIRHTFLGNTRNS